GDRAHAYPLVAVDEEQLGGRRDDELTTVARACSPCRRRPGFPAHRHPPAAHSGHRTDQLFSRTTLARRRLPVTLCPVLPDFSAGEFADRGARNRVDEID